MGNAATPRIRNEVVLQGEFSSDVDTAIDTTHSEAGVVRGKMSIFKVDGKDYSKTLPGAKFKLSEFNPETSQWDVKKVGNSEELVTNENGEISFAGTNKEKFLSAFNLYKVEEIEAPDGYELNKKPYYFSIYQADIDKTKQDAIDEMNNREIFTKSGINSSDVWFVPNNKEVSLYVPNDSNSIYVKKVWVDSENKQITYHPDSINVNLIQNIKTPTGVTVKSHIYTLNWDGTENTVDDKTLVVRKGGSIKMTLPVWCKPGDEASQVSVTGATDYRFSNDNQSWGHVVLTINNVTSNMNLRIKLNGNDGRPVEYDYDKEYSSTNFRFFS